MKAVLIIFVVFAMGCANKVDMAANQTAQMDYDFSQRVDFSAELPNLEGRESFTEFRTGLDETQKIAWLGFQVARCESLYGQTELGERCALNEARVLRLFSILPIELMSEEQFLVTLEVYQYYQSLQLRRSDYSVVYVNFPEELSSANQQLLLSRTASPLALFIVAVRDVLNEEDDTVY
ncbi:hypothetical protein [Umboniibacter marinipuniceus]|uniref:Uncharacterized protein n=1 Tax=Umboniibacter marinipuniceus TaxID=569599 RepID=A0A3M0AJI7_9GAMM|nr:hypothetical protein [Umboniibacter marinipuniceus]RMA82735.1 hypothetical protein DFR27_0693 [Umboniibacter marinipuniceus]